MFINTFRTCSLPIITFVFFIRTCPLPIRTCPLPIRTCPKFISTSSIWTLCLFLYFKPVIISILPPTFLFDLRSWMIKIFKINSANINFPYDWLNERFEQWFISIIIKPFLLLIITQNVYSSHIFNKIFYLS